MQKWINIAENSQVVENRKFIQKIEDARLHEGMHFAKSFSHWNQIRTWLRMPLSWTKLHPYRIPRAIWLKNIVMSNGRYLQAPHMPFWTHWNACLKYERVQPPLINFLDRFFRRPVHIWRSGHTSFCTCSCTCSWPCSRTQNGKSWDSWQGGVANPPTIYFHAHCIQHRFMHIWRQRRLENWTTILSNAAMPFRPVTKPSHPLLCVEQRRDPPDPLCDYSLSYQVEIGQITGMKHVHGYVEFTSGICFRKTLI